MRRALMALMALALAAEGPVEHRLRADIGYLASPALKGRGQGTPGLEMASEHLLKTYRKLGIVAQIQRYPSRATTDPGGSQSANIVAIIPGTDPELRKEYIALGAHFDHLGDHAGALSLAPEEGRQQIHPGADDNASGTALVLDLARRLRKHPARRSILLLHFSGEELGLLGSAHWSAHPTVPLGQVKFYFNFDMVGRLDPISPKLEIGYIGAGAAETALIDRHAPRRVMLSHDLGIFLGASDHLSLATQKVPTAFYFTGTHTDYHRPSDTPDKINYAGEALIEGAALGAIREMADARIAPAFDGESAKWLFPAPTHVSKAVLGAQPGEGTDPRGLLLSDSREGTPAAELGLRAGDILVSFMDQPIKTLFDLNANLGKCAAGDRVRVVWIRGGVTTEAEVVLMGR